MAKAFLLHILWYGAALALALPWPSTSQAWDGNARIYAKSNAPYWDVGRRDNNLSRLCGLGRFNQKYKNRMYIQFSGDKGRGLTGIALKGWNLIDVDGKALDGKTYHFYRDGTSQCIVFVAP
ncbi:MULTISPECIES: hypothetical protein [unclassified Haematospirillum]|uniref:hypothetical protein n=1 Tax=unclassified Haematospirillum TaxID=2622088 RepID=UPI00143BE7A4|nr:MULTISPECIES: hypothetical protein [unclassified Haematospirillum]NKD54554.1 hypothetical protein [Haematospirillum sp. H4890]NKD74834.1 hypothetical protein [Haematospirillum sp. H4485]NKD88044.1 hypothetical protein [Haematospirillum sp. 15-248]